jgi:hypothetical protein
MHVGSACERTQTSIKIGRWLVRTERAEEMRGFEISGFGPKDARHVQRSAEHLGPLLPAVLDALYDQLLSLPETRGIFETQGIQHRKQ